MEIGSLVSLFLSEWIVANFDILKGSTDPANEQIDIWLDEKKQAPTYYYA